MNSVVLVGRLTKDPELRYIPNSGTPVATFTIAVDRDYKKKDGTKETDFITIEVIGGPAEFCANYLSKGRLIAAQGSIKVDRYQTQEGENRTFTKVSVRNVQALDYAKDNSSKPDFEPTTGLDPNGFHEVDDEEIPF